MLRPPPFPRWLVVPLLSALVAVLLPGAGPAQPPKDRKEREVLTKKRQVLVADLVVIGQEASKAPAKTKARKEWVARFDQRYREATALDARLRQPQPAPTAALPLATLKQRLAALVARQKELRDLLRVAPLDAWTAYRSLLQQFDKSETEIEALQALIRQKEKGASPKKDNGAARKGNTQRPEVASLANAGGPLQ